jgi:hypothetical protein
VRRGNSRSGGRSKERTQGHGSEHDGGAHSVQAAAQGEAPQARAQSAA